MKQPFLTVHPQGILISLRITTKSSKTGPLGIIESSLKWGVNAPPVEGKANEALIEDMAKRLKCAKSRISIYKGAQSKHKVILVEGGTIQEMDIF